MFRCPFCDYESDSRGSVEAHISGKSDSSHEGKVGRSYRSEIEEESEPEGFVGRLRKKVGENPQLQSILEEVRRIRQSHREDIDDLEDRLDELEAELERRRGLGRKVERVEAQQAAAVSVLIEDVRALDLLLAEIIRERNEMTCPRCQQQVVLDEISDEARRVECPNCYCRPLRAVRQAISPDDEPAVWEETRPEVSRSLRIPDDWLSEVERR